MTITFRSEKVEAHHWMNLSNDNAFAVMAAAGIDRFNVHGTGEIPLEVLPLVLHSIEITLASPTALKQYVRPMSDERPVFVQSDGVSNVVKLKHGPWIYDAGIDEEYLRRKLARLYILITAALDAESTLQWG